MKITVFAHNGAISAIAFPGEATNYNGSAVLTVEVAEGENVLEKLTEAGVGGVGSPYPAEKVEAAKPAPKKK
ncbi:hypothetical protein [Variovorax paradoxus]|uniref:hypothetical protein n=1 Tax=Variovorax paradoxus TaxID=34073 RepID=UPI0028652D9B|nr:hypothetical protein [Variovorax paradoxus]MDR6455487.1 hypothetical protein [Variovorax paradoxus]